MVRLKHKNREKVFTITPDESPLYQWGLEHGYGKVRHDWIEEYLVSDAKDYTNRINGVWLGVGE